jgi:hypothetical protein
MSFEPGDSELWVEGGSNSVEADIRLEEECKGPG